MLPKKKISWLLLTAGAMVFFIAVSFLEDMNLSLLPFLPKCLFHEITGLFCPGCGTGRTMNNLLHGHIYSAFGNNILAALLVPYIILEVASSAFFSKDPIIRISNSPLFGWAIVLLVIGFSVLRTIPAYPFNLLAP